MLLLAFNEGNKAGIYNLDNNCIVVPAEYDRAEVYDRGICVWRNSTQGFLREDNEFVVPLQADIKRIYPLKDKVLIEMHNGNFSALFASCLQETR